MRIVLEAEVAIVRNWQCSFELLKEYLYSRMLKALPEGLEIEANRP